MPCKILFAGGCHVNGEAPDGDTKLASVAMRLLGTRGVQCEPGYLIPIRLSHPRRLAQKCAEFRPDVLVMQPGYPETANLISQYVKRKLGRPAGTHGSADALAAYDGAFDGSWQLEVKWFFRSRTKRLLDAITGHRLVDLPQLSTFVDRFFSRVAALAVPHVVVLSPLPCADPIALYYRRRLAPMLQATAAEYGYPYLDVVDLGARRLFLDPYHLNRAGHELIGRMTGGTIAAALGVAPRDERTILFAAH